MLQAVVSKDCTSAGFCMLLKLEGKRKAGPKAQQQVKPNFLFEKSGKRVKLAQ